MRGRQFPPHRKETTWPTVRKTSSSCSSVALYGMFPTNTDRAELERDDIAPTPPESSESSSWFVDNFFRDGPLRFCSRKNTGMKAGNQDAGLARADMLAKSSSAALRRLNRRVECLEKDVLPVHEETKILVNGGARC